MNVAVAPISNIVSVVSTFDANYVLNKIKRFNQTF